MSTRRAALVTPVGAVYAGRVTDADGEARRYHRWQIVVSLVGFGLSVGLLVTRLARGAAAALAAPSRPMIVAGVLAAIGIPEALG